MYELLNFNTLEHETLVATDYYSAIEEAKEKASSVGGEFLLIDNRDMSTCLHFHV